MAEFSSLNGYDVKDKIARENIIEIENDINLLSTFVTPQMFGAVGDGVTDDTLPIKNMVLDATSSGKYCYIPHGVYKISETISIPENVRLVGVYGSWYKVDGSVFIKENEGAVFSVHDYSEIGNIQIEGNNTANGIQIEGGRAYIHDVCINHCEYGLLNGTLGTNLSRFNRVTIIGCETAIELTDNNGTNSQSMTFLDIDIRECKFGLVTYQPANKFYNFCVQAGTTGGCSVVFKTGANNNEFVGTYFENPNYTYEVDFEEGQYNNIVGNRVVGYVIAFTNNDGTNTYTARSNQNISGMFEMGNKYFDSFGIVADKNDAGMPVSLLKFDGDGNNINVVPNNTSQKIRLIPDNVSVYENNLTHESFSQKFQGFGITTLSKAFDSIPAGGSTVFSTAFLTHSDQLLMIQCSNIDVYAVAIPGTNNFTVRLKNTGTTDLINVTLDFTLVFAKKVN